MDTKQLVRDTAHAFNQQTRWDIGAAMDLAVETLTDANGHEEVRLIQAGPDLLAALRVVLVDGEQAGWLPSFHAQTARAAIAKAEGGAE